MNTAYATYHDQYLTECGTLTGGFVNLSVLVPGAGTGTECAMLTAAGARVTGLDIDGPAATVRGSIERSPFLDGSFDLVFCIATMEHVSDIEAGFSEMVRALKPGGLIYSIAAPLWNSRRGHHFDCLNAIPWAHLRLTRQELEALPLQHNGMPLKDCLSYLLDSPAFNRAPAARYLAAGRSLRVAQMIKNDLWMDGAEELTPKVASELAAYSRDELLATAHALVARK